VTRDDQPGTLEPRADNTNDDRQEDARCRQLQRREKARNETRSVEGVVKNGEVDAGGVIQPPPPKIKGFQAN